MRSPKGTAEYVVVRLRINQFDPPYRFLLYSRSAPRLRWRFRGSVDFGFEDTDTCYPPEPTIHEMGSEQWLVLRYPRVCRCTGCYNVQEQWLQMRESQLRKVHVINKEGRDFSGFDYDPAWEWKEELLKVGMSGSTETLQTKFTVYFFKTCRGGTPLAVRTAHAIFTREPGAEFTFEPSLSDADYKDLVALTNFPGIESIERNEVLLKYAMDSLERAARKPGPGDRQWLSDFLSRCGESPETVRLTRLLNTTAKDK